MSETSDNHTTTVEQRPSAAPAPETESHPSGATPGNTEKLPSSTPTASLVKEDEAPESVQEAESEPESSKDGELSLGRFNACFDGLSRIGPLALLAALLCMAWPIFWEPAKGVFCPAEIKSLTAFLHCIATNSWLAPVGLDGNAWTLAQWPGFTWITGLMALSPALTESGYLLPATSFLCTFFAVLGVWCLAHAAGFGYRAAFAAGLILLCSPLFAPLPHFVGPATIAAGFLLFALVFFCRGWRGHASWFSLPIAFMLTALAGLSGGLLHFIVPLAASFCYLIWRGELRRAQKADAICGFILMLIIIGCWLGALALYHPNDAYLSLLFSESWQWIWPIPIKWLLPLAAGLLGTMPWLLMIFGVSWVHVLTNAGRTLNASRKENGSALIWISVTLALIIAVFIPWFHPSAVAISCLAAILLGKAAVNLASAGGRFFYLLASLCLIIAGCVIICLSFEFSQQFILGLLPQLPVPDLGAKLLTLSTLPIMGGILALGGLIALMFARRFSGCGPLIYAILLVIILCQPARLLLVGELAAMPGSPLVSYSTIETHVNQLLTPQTKNEPVPLEAPIQAVPEENNTPDLNQPDQMPALPQPVVPGSPGPDEQVINETIPVTPEIAQPAAPEIQQEPENTGTQPADQEAPQDKAPTSSSAVEPAQETPAESQNKLSPEQPPVQ